MLPSCDSILSRLLSPLSLMPPDIGSTMPQLVLTCRSHIQDVMCVMGRFFDPPPRFLSMGLAKLNFQIQPGTVPLYLCAVSTVSWSTASFNGRGGSHTRLHAASIKGHLEVVPLPFKTVQILKSRNTEGRVLRVLFANSRRGFHRLSIKARSLSMLHSTICAS